MTSGKTFRSSVVFLRFIGIRVQSRGDGLFDLLKGRKVCCKELDAEDVRLFAAGVNHGVVIAKEALQ